MSYSFLHPFVGLGGKKSTSGKKNYYQRHRTIAFETDSASTLPANIFRCYRSLKETEAKETLDLKLISSLLLLLQETRQESKLKPSRTFCWKHDMEDFEQTEQRITSKKKRLLMQFYYKACIIREGRKCEEKGRKHCSSIRIHSMRISSSWISLFLFLPFCVTNRLHKKSKKVWLRHSKNRNNKRSFRNRRHWKRERRIEDRRKNR